MITILRNNLSQSQLSYMITIQIKYISPFSLKIYIYMIGSICISNCNFFDKKNCIIYSILIKY